MIRVRSSKASSNHKTVTKTVTEIKNPLPRNGFKRFLIGLESHLSHQNSGYPLRGDRNFLCGDRTRKGGTSPQTGVKSVRWTLFSPWESPSKSRCIRYGCGWILNMSDTEKCWCGRIFLKSYKNTRTKKERVPLVPSLFFARDGTRKPGLSKAKA